MLSSWLSFLACVFVVCGAPQPGPREQEYPPLAPAPWLSTSAAELIYTRMSLHTTCTIVNNSTFPLVPITSHFKAGEWIVPPATVPERSSIVFSARPSTRSLGRLEWAQHFELRINEIHHIDISLASERHFAAQTSKTSTAAAIFSKSLNDTFDAQSRARRVTISPEHYLTIHPETGWHRFVLYADPKNCSFALTFAPEKLTEELQV